MCYVLPVSYILGRLPLVPVGDDGKIPRTLHGVELRKDTHYPVGKAGPAGSSLYLINSWAMSWPSDFPSSSNFEEDDNDD